MKKNIFTLIVAITFFACADYEREKNVAEVKRLEQKEAYGDAIVLLGEMLKDDPDNVYVLYERSKLLTEQNNIQNALLDLNHAIDVIMKNSSFAWGSTMFNTTINTGLLHVKRAELLYATGSVIPALLDYEYCINKYVFNGSEICRDEMRESLRKRDEIYEEIKKAPAAYARLMNRTQSQFVNRVSDSTSVHINNTFMHDVMNSDIHLLKFNGPVWLDTRKQYEIRFSYEKGKYMIDSTAFFTNTYEFDRNKQLKYNSSFNSKTNYANYVFYRNDTNFIMRCGYTNQDDLGVALDQKYTLDNQGRIVKREVYYNYASGKKNECFENIAYNKANLIKRKWLSCDADTTCYQYDLSGRLVKLYCKKKDSIVYAFAYIYDKDVMYEYELNKDKQYQYKRVYTYDKYGNWVQCKYYRDGAPTLITIRDIIYYE